MKLARITTPGGLPDYAVGTGDGWVPYTAVDLAAPTVVEAVTLFPQALERARAHTPTEIEGRDLAAPIHRPGKILAIGLNYLDHIIETKSEPPQRPVVFAKYPSSVIGPFDNIVIDPRLTNQGDYEAELAVVIGKRSRSVSEEDALDVVFGYAVANDVSARDWQRAESQFSRSKSFDTFCPVGPWITTADEIADPNALEIGSMVNGDSRQQSTTAKMIFSVRYLISYLSQTMTLEPGDTILTGTPHGVGFAMSPPRFLQPADRVVCEVEGLGRIDNEVVGVG